MYYVLCWRLISLWATYCLILRNGEPFVEVDTSYISHKTILHPHHSPLFGSMQLFHIESFLQCYNTAALLYYLLWGHTESFKRKKDLKKSRFLVWFTSAESISISLKGGISNGQWQYSFSYCFGGSLLKYTHNSIRGKMIHSMQLKSTFISYYIYNPRDFKYWLTWWNLLHMKVQ